MHSSIKAKDVAIQRLGGKPLIIKKKTIIILNYEIKSVEQMKEALKKKLNLKLHKQKVYLFETL